MCYGVKARAVCTGVDLPGEKRMSEISSFLWWNCTMSSRVSALTTTKLPADDQNNGQ